jgi:hypothetical protein
MLNSSSFYKINIVLSGCYFLKRIVVIKGLSLKGLPYIVAAFHLFHRVGDHMKVDEMEVAVKDIFKRF